MLDNLAPRTVVRDGVSLHSRSGGQGPPLLLLHGHPQSMAMWHRVVPALAEHFHLVLMDLRGYGDSGRPAADAEHRVHSKREMAWDAMAVLQTHRFERFAALAHDRGVQVTHRLATEQPQAVSRLLLYVAPTPATCEHTSEAFARAHWHRFFFIRPPRLPDELPAERTVAHCFDVLALWRERAAQLSGQTLPCGHYIAEEAPEALLAQAILFFNDTDPRSTP